MGKATTWADWLGIWHASVPLTSSRHRDAMAARKAIRDELDAQDVSPAYALKVTRERKSPITEPQSTGNFEMNAHERRANND